VAGAAAFAADGAGAAVEAAGGGGALAGAAGCAVCAKQAPPKLAAAKNDKASKDLRLKLMVVPQSMISKSGRLFEQDHAAKEKRRA
jgi:hypothetical protein